MHQHSDPGQTDESVVSLVPVADLLPAALAHIRRQRLAVRSADGAGFDLRDPANPDFRLELDTDWLRDPRRVLEMFRHLSDKRWCTGQHLADLAAAALQHLDDPKPPAPRARRGMRVIEGGRTT